MTTNFVNTNILNVTVPPHLKIRVESGIEFWDVVTSGGLVPSTTSMLSGSPGAGKTTLCAQLAESLAERGHLCFFNSAEQTKEQVSYLCRERLKLKHGFMFETYKDAKSIMDHARKLRKDHPNQHLFLFVDSLTKLAHGKRSEAQRIGNEFIDFCQDTHTIGIFIVHLTKSGQFQGNNGMLHDFDAYWHMHVEDEESDDGFRMIQTRKNRFGKKHTVFTELTETGHVVPTKSESDDAEEIDDDDIIEEG